jgi:hypothetical protein
MLRRLQDRPRLLEFAYQGSFRLLSRFRRWLVPGSQAERFLIWIERISKQALFDCRMCGQCILHSTGMTCPMTCPKNLRNGPCGGVLLNGHCEIYPERPCVWVQAWERSRRMPAFGSDLLHLQAPLNHQLQGSSAWINELHRKELLTPIGWEE